MTDKRHEDVVEAVARIIEQTFTGYSIKMVAMIDEVATYRAVIDGEPPREFDSYVDASEWVQERRHHVQAAKIIAALNTRPDVEADMRERCARFLEERGDILLNSSTNLSAGIMMKNIFDAEATAIRSLPLSTEGKSCG